MAACKSEYGKPRKIEYLKNSTCTLNSSNSYMVRRVMLLLISTLEKRWSKKHLLKIITHFWSVLCETAPWRTVSLRLIRLLFVRKFTSYYLPKVPSTTKFHQALHQFGKQNLVRSFQILILLMQFSTVPLQC